MAPAMAPAGRDDVAPSPRRSRLTGWSGRAGNDGAGT